MLRTRVLTALGLMALLLPAILVFPTWAWGLVMLVVIGGAAHEWTSLLTQGAGAVPPSGSALAGATQPAPQAGFAATLPTVGAAIGIGGLLLLWRMLAGWPQALVVVVTGLATLWWCVVAPIRLRRHDAQGGGRFLAIVLLLAGWLALVDLHARGPAVLFAAMAIVWVADIAAYFVGRALGRRKLAPAISPGKSWEGAIGGVLAVVLCASLLAWLAPTPFDRSLVVVLQNRLAWPLAAALLALLVALSIVGDLHESLLKRQARVKDSGTLLPGHGGILDRIDALMPVMPAACLLHRLLEWT